MAIQVDCINKTPRQDPHERIQFLGGPNQDRTRWKLTQPGVIEWIENGKGPFYVEVNGQRVNLIVATHNGHKYVKTENDGIQPNNLLALPEC